MKAHILVAGWPFAGLLALDAGRAEVSSATPVRGLIVEAGAWGDIVVLDTDDATFPLMTDASTRWFGVDGYPIARGDIRVGATIEAVHERIGDERLATYVRVLRLTVSAGRLA